jgi:hypothetical protein
VKAFERLRSMAVYGADARALIVKAIAPPPQRWEATDPLPVGQLLYEHAVLPIAAT